MEETYDETAHFNSELNTRLAVRLGRALMEGEAVGLRAEFAERKLAARGEALTDIMEEQAALQARLDALTTPVTADAAHVVRLEAAVAEVPVEHLPTWFRAGADAPTTLRVEPPPITEPAPGVPDGHHGKIGGLPITEPAP